MSSKLKVEHINESVDVLDVLFTPESAALIAFCGVLLAAAINFLGILANNFYENRRRNKKRQQSLIKETYLGALEYLSFFYYHLIKLASAIDIPVDESFVVSVFERLGHDSRVVLHAKIQSLHA